jgi:hypothetical protein
MVKPPYMRLNVLTRPPQHCDGQKITQSCSRWSSENPRDTQVHVLKIAYTFSEKVLLKVLSEVELSVESSSSSNTSS